MKSTHFIRFSSQRRLINNISLLISLLVFMLMGSCGGIQRANSSIYNSLYTLPTSFEHDLFVRQLTEDSATVYFQLSTDQLLHKRADRNQDYIVIADFHVMLKQNGVPVLDSLQYRYQASYMAPQSEWVYGRFNIPLRDTIRYEVEVLVEDVLSKRSSSIISFLGTDKDDPRYLSTSVNGIPQRYCSCSPGDEVLIAPYKYTSGRSQMTLYSRELGLAPPPFSISPNPRPQLDLLSSEEVNHSDMLSVTCPDADVIHLQHSETENVIKVNRFPTGFPEINDQDQMVSMLKYVTTSNEYKAMVQSENVRADFEYFWVDCAGSKERARSLMSNFYGRAEQANRSFSVRGEGWKSDRGLIHMIYGPPSQIMHLLDREIWFFGAEQAENSWNVVFYKRGDFEMDRSLDYRQSWFLSVDSWRNGRSIGK